MRLLATLGRLFVPSWRFFDDAASGIVLRARVTRASANAGPWVQVLLPPTRRPHHILWNPEGNRVLAAYSLLERLLQDVAEDDARSLRTSLALVTELVRAEVTRRGLAAPGDHVEFVVVDREPDGEQELLRSERFAC